MHVTLPNFLVVGAMKAGTTTLQHILARHPDVFMARLEAHFFDKDDNYRRGLDWYAQHFEGAEGKTAIGEKTPTYSYLPAAAERIHTHFPDIKLVWLFRDPVKRAYSNYWHAVKRGEEPLSFEEAVGQEEERIQRNIFRGYVRRSIYADQVERFLDLFAREQMFFITFETLVREPEQVLSGLWRFLEVEDFAISQVERVRSNVTYIPHSKRLEHMARRLLGNGIPYRIVSRMNRRLVPGYPPIALQIRDQLKEFFRPHNRRLAELTGLDTGIWDR